MATTRLKKIGGNYRDENFHKLLSQLNGRALLVVTVINEHCDECAKLHKFIGQLEQGFIDKMPQMVMVYGINNQPIDETVGENKTGKASVNPEGRTEEPKTKLADSRTLNWESIPEGHGYGIFLSEKDVLLYKGIFDHDEYVSNIIDNIRRFQSSIKTIAGLAGKRLFLEKRRSGIIIETSGATQNSQIMDIENKVKSYEGRLKIPVYFCKSISQEMSYVIDGEVKFKMKGFNFDKLLRKIPRS